MGEGERRASVVAQDGNLECNLVPGLRVSLFLQGLPSVNLGLT